MGPLPPNESEVSDSSRTVQTEVAAHDFSEDERRILLQVAHDSIRAKLQGLHFSFDPPPHLAEPRGVFTTLYLKERLRGCVGYVFPTLPLHRGVAETARGAAFGDPRFPPLQSEEAAGIKVSLSVLSTLVSIQPDQIEIGRHGLLISLGGSRGLLLPQVAVEHGWDRQMFLQQTCRKAGLPEDAWQKGVQIEAFTAEIFSDESVRA